MKCSFSIGTPSCAKCSVGGACSVRARIEKLEKALADERATRMAGVDALKRLVAEAEKEHAAACLNGTTMMQVGAMERKRIFKEALRVVRTPPTAPMIP